MGGSALGAQGRGGRETMEPDSKYHATITNIRRGLAESGVEPARGLRAPKIAVSRSCWLMTVRFGQYCRRILYALNDSERQGYSTAYRKNHQGISADACWLRFFTAQTALGSAVDLQLIDFLVLPRSSSPPGTRPTYASVFCLVDNSRYDATTRG